MSPAQRRQRIKSFKFRCGRKISWCLIIPIILVLGLILYLIFGTKLWGISSKTSVVSSRSDGSAVVSVFDLTNEEITNLYIPASTQLEVSRNLGTWRVKSIWKLGINEKIEGELLRASIVKNFHFPVIAWADESIYKLASGELSGWKSIFTGVKTNLSYPDRIRMAFFAMGVKNTKRLDIDLIKTRVLKTTTLTDGEEGYVVSNKIPEDIKALFSLDNKEGKLLKVNIVNNLGLSDIASSVGETAEVLGAKVASIDQKDLKNYNCEVGAVDAKIAKQVSLVFGCVVKGQPKGSYDLEIRLGEGFKKVY